MTRPVWWLAVFGAMALVSPAAAAQACDEEQLLASDQDGDGLPDVVERFLGTNVNDRDTDLDGVDDAIEVLVLRSDPVHPDTDGDGLCDGGASVPGFCRAGEDLNGDGIIEADNDEEGESDPVCSANESLPVTRTSVRGSNVFGCAASGSPGHFAPLWLVSTLLFVQRWRRARRRHPRLGAAPA